MRGELGHARRLVDTPDIDVRENRAPARRHERRQFGHHPLFEFGIEIKAHLAAVSPVEKRPQIDLFGDRMRHHLRQPHHFGRHAVDENPVVQLQPDRKIQLRRQGERLLEVGARNRMPGHDAAVTHQAVGAVERRHAVVRNRLQIGQIGRRAPRGDEQLHAARMGLTQRIERRSGHPVGLETDQRSVDIQKYSLYHYR